MASIHLGAAGDAQHEVREDDEQRDEKEGNGRTGGQIAALYAQSKGQGRQSLRGVEWPPRGEDVNHRHVCEREDKTKEYSHAEDWTHHRNDNLELGAPEACSIDGRSFRNILGNGRAPGEKNHGGEGNDTPAVNKEDGSNGEARFAEPHGRVEWFVEVKGDKDPGDDTVDRIEKPLPTDGPERYWRNPRKQDEKPDQTAAAKRILQCNGEDVGADNHHDLRADGENQRIAYG